MEEKQAFKLIAECEKENVEAYQRIDEIAFYNQKKVLDAFRKRNVALRHFSGSSGYGYEDCGKHVLSAVFADAFGAEAGLVSPLFASGTHAISTVLFGLLRPGETVLSISGMPYDTLIPVLMGKGIGSLAEFGIKFNKVDLQKNGDFDIVAIQKFLLQKPKMVYIQRSRGYTWRNSFTVSQIGQIVALVRRLSPQSIIVVDNCYGEFTECEEPISAGADVIVGSLIKNPGGGLAQTGGYVCGVKAYVDLIANRLTAPGLGADVGSYAYGYRTYFQGLFLAPHTTAQALKGALLFQSVFSKLGYEVLPSKDSNGRDIICSIRFHSCDEMTKFCRAIQRASPIDSFATPEPSDMPGYADKVIMAAGTFVQGSSIELSADGPVREPYIAHVQGGLIYPHIKIAVCECLQLFDIT